MQITPKYTITFTGADGKKNKIFEGVPVEVDQKDIKHLDKADYVVGEAAPEPQTKKKK